MILYYNIIKNILQVSNIPIVNILGSIDDKIENNEKMCEKLEIFAAKQFAVITPQANKIPIQNFSEKIVCGKTPLTSNAKNFGRDIPFITIPDLHNNVFITKTERSLSNEGANSQSSQTLPSNSICVSCIASPGLVSITSTKSQTNQQINSIVCNNDCSPYYMYLAIKSIKEEIINAGRGGSTTYNLNKNNFSQLTIPFVSKNSMDNFHNQVKLLFKKILLCQIENQKLSELKQLYLKKFFG